MDGFMRFITDPQKNITGIRLMNPVFIRIHMQKQNSVR